MSKRPPQVSSVGKTERALSEALGLSLDREICFVKESSEPATSAPKSPKIWRDLGHYLESLQGMPREAGGAGPITDKKNPLSSPVAYRICNHCDKPFLETHIADHIKACMTKKNRATPSAAGTAQTKKKRKLAEADGLDTKENTPSAVGSPQLDGSITPTTGAKSNKRAKKTAVVKEKRKKKEKAKASSKDKGPVDVEKQCGVALPAGGLCARSLTCKTHSMGAKRAVPGRSAPYDQLLAAYQRKNQAKLVAGAAAAQAAQEDMLNASSVPLDDDEETQQVLEGVMRSYPLPLERRTIMPVRMRSQFLRMREMFAGAILPRIAANPLGGLNGRTAVVDIDKVDDYYYLVRSPQRVPQHSIPRAPATAPSQLSGQDSAQVRAQQQAQALMRARAQQAGLTPQMQQRVMSNPQVAAQRAAGIYNTQNNQNKMAAAAAAASGRQQQQFSPQPR